MKVFVRNQQKLIKINQKNIKYDSSKILRLLDIKDAELSILLVNDRKMKELNSKYRCVDKTTDVLSFPQMPEGQGSRFKGRKKNKITPCYLPLATYPLPLGDIVINLQAAKRQAPEHGLSFKEELRWLIIHGILHLIGYDHERSKYAERKMRAKERELLDYLGGANRCLQNA